MADNDQSNLYAAQIAILARLIDAENRAKGRTRSGGDYVAEAIQEVQHTKRRLGHV